VPRDKKRNKEKEKRKKKRKEREREGGKREREGEERERDIRERGMSSITVKWKSKAMICSSRFSRNFRELFFGN
jgi:hypothetical protein